MKTLKQFEKQVELDVDQFLKPLDRIDEDFYHHITCAYVAANFTDQHFGQNGECCFEKDGIRYYSTVANLNDKFYYLGKLPSFEPSVYPDKEREENWNF